MGLLKTIHLPQVRKLFGKRELVIMEKQLMGVKLTQSERNRLSRDIRLKLSAVQALAPFEQEFRLRGGDEVKRCIEEAKAAILASAFAPRIRRILLFGSTVTGQRNLQSDIDLAVEFTSITPQEASRFRLRMVADVEEGMDIRLYNVLPRRIQQDIEKTGKVLYEQAHQRKSR